MDRIKIPYVEFYTINNCNLACQGCNRFNNFKFTGFQKWDDYSTVYQQWSKKLTFGWMTLMGGEPLLNPTLFDWMSGLRSLWPDVKLRVMSNGFLLDKRKDLYNHLSNDVNLWIGIHNKQHKKEILSKVYNFLQGNTTTVFNSDNPYMQYMDITDENGITVRVEYNWWFHQGSIVITELGKTLHQSNPTKAHNICHQKTCHHFSKGKLYKCGVVTVLPEFNQQHNLLLSDQDINLLNEYAPLSVTDSDEQIADFVANLPNEIPQCKFCPEEYHGEQIFAVEKKIIPK
jgi:hypothetical protein